MKAAAPLLAPSVAFLAPFVDAEIFEHADVHVTAAISRVAAETDEPTLLALALSVRATRLGHVCVVLDDIPTSLVPASLLRDDTPDDEQAPFVGELPWPARGAWAEHLRASAAVASGSAAPGEPIRPLVFDGTRVYLERYWRHEQTVATDLLERAAADAVADTPSSVPVALLDRLFGPAPEGGPDLQRVAAEAALTRRLVVIAGGPGTGKTRTVARLLAAAHQMAIDGDHPLVVALAAPTGKAAQRMTEAVRNEITTAGLPPSLAGPLLATEATTIHRLLGPTGGLEFRHDRDDPLAADIVVVDEASMVSLPLMARLLDAVRPEARLVLVGDPYQLTSIEAGAVLGDVVGPAALAGWGGSPRSAVRARGRFGPLAGGVVVLERVHRFGADSAIAALADAVRGGDADAALEILDSGAGDVTWVRPDDTAALGAVQRVLVDNALEVVHAAWSGDRRAGLAAAGDLKVLAATRRGPLGTHAWRERIERLVARRDARVPVGRRWYVGRPVIATENDYSNALFNGDTGLVVATDEGSAVAFPSGDATRDLQPSQLSAVETWWSMTIHKSQGSEFRHAVVSLPEAGSPILTRELLYTAITRAREQLTVVAGEASLRAAIGRSVGRASGLQARLWP